MRTLTWMGDEPNAEVYDLAFDRNLFVEKSERCTLEAKRNAFVNARADLVFSRPRFDSRKST